MDRKQGLCTEPEASLLKVLPVILCDIFFMVCDVSCICQLFNICDFMISLLIPNNHSLWYLMLDYLIGIIVLKEGPQTT